MYIKEYASLLFTFLLLAIAVYYGYKTKHASIDENEEDEE